MSEKLGRIADMVSPLGHLFRYGASASAYLHALRCQLGSADRLQFGHGLAQLLDHQVGKRLEPPRARTMSLSAMGCWMSSGNTRWRISPARTSSSTSTGFRKVIAWPLRATFFRNSIEFV